MRGAFATAGAFVFDRMTYDIVAECWPAATDDEDIARALNGLPKYVASTTLKEPTWQPTIVLDGDVVEALRALKNQPGKDIVVVGSPALARRWSSWRHSSTNPRSGCIPSCSASASVYSPSSRRPSRFGPSARTPRLRAS